MEKYYTPTIEEFHVGFEYELLQGKDNPKWNKLILGLDDTWYHTHFKFPVHINAFIKMSKCRVKHLDKQDIEECGWKYGTDYNERMVFHNKREVLIFVMETNQLAITEAVGGLPEDITVPLPYLFNGKIKNKSELKRLMYQLTIIP